MIWSDLLFWRFVNQTLLLLLLLLPCNAGMKVAASIHLSDEEERKN
jgi:hypothetical protein